MNEHPIAPTPSSDDRPLLSVRQVAARLGVAENTVRQYVATGRLSRVGGVGRVRIRPADLDAFLDGERIVRRRGQRA